MFVFVIEWVWIAICIQQTWADSTLNPKKYSINENYTMVTWRFCTLCLDCSPWRPGNILYSVCKLTIMFLWWIWILTLSKTYINKQKPKIFLNNILTIFRVSPCVPLKQRRCLFLACWGKQFSVLHCCIFCFVAYS